MSPVPAVGAIVVQDGSLLMIRRGRGPAGGSWSVPGGKIERGEMAAEAVIRELAEETGLIGLCGELVGWTEIIEDEHHFVVLDFEVVVLSTDPPVAGSDAAEAAWIDVADVAELNLAPGLAQFLADHDVIPTIV
jgi:8-oxo-dGTP diphosphatase